MENSEYNERSAHLEDAASLEITSAVSHNPDLSEPSLQKRSRAVDSFQSNEKATSGRGWLLTAGLSGLVFVVAAAVFFLYLYEKNVNESVLRLQHDAKTAALAGEYDKALDLLVEAAEARPGFAAIAADAEIIQHVSELERMIKEVETSLSSHNTQEADKTLQKLLTEFNGHKEPIYIKLRERLDKLDMDLTLQKLNKQFESLATIKEHGDMLNLVNGMTGEGAASLKKRLVSRIREMTIGDAEHLLNKKDYNDALSVVNRSLALVKDDAELLKLRKDIQDEQAKYERLEQQRIEQAMQRAAEEDLINQTAAVEVVTMDTTLDEFGDLTIDGTLRNAATRAIYSVTVEFTVKSKEGEELGKGTASATPNYIEPGEQMKFQSTVYGVLTEEVEIVIDHATWYLD
ncbi:FxLYD domain-containing protein [Paenibacillus sp. GCM10027627]